MVAKGGHVVRLGNLRGSLMCSAYFLTCYPWVLNNCWPRVGTGWLGLLTTALWAVCVNTQPIE